MFNKNPMYNKKSSLNKSLIALAIAAVVPTSAFAHGNVDVSNGSQMEVYVANEEHHGHGEAEKAYGIEAIWMHESGFFVYAEGETGAHDFYQVGAGQYFKPTDNIGLFAYGAYAQGGYEDSNELRARLGVDYQVTHEFALHARLGFDYGNSAISVGDDHDHDHSFSNQGSKSKNSQIGRLDAGFSYEIGHVAEFSYNYVVQTQYESALVQDNDTNLHYEARLTYTDAALKPYVEYRQTNKAFDSHHFEESAVQFGISFNY
ncbi:hypothetical protein [Vibrio gallicus]|uniref:hypothetical protein n=1 Tax=Vibrio gallicus TaxID=190897 RepID=UPI0021C3DF83|nr:hypothetical protein [Vibrio gallicus]